MKAEHWSTNHSVGVEDVNLFPLEGRLLPERW